MVNLLPKETTLIRIDIVLFKTIYVSFSHTVANKTWTKCSMITFQTIAYQLRKIDEKRHTYLCTQYLSYVIILLSTNKYNKAKPSGPLICLYICLKRTRSFALMTVNVNSVLMKSTYQVKCLHSFHVAIDDIGMSVYGIWSHPSPRPHFPFSSAAISLLRFCRVVGYVYIFPLSCLLRLFYCLKFNRILSRGIIRWAWYFFIDITSKCWSTENFLN